MKKLVPKCLRPDKIALASLEEDPDFRSDLLFFVRLAGTYAQTIFWLAFPRSAMARRKKMFEIAKQKIPQNKGPFRAAVLDRKARHAKTTDLFHNGFVELLRALESDRDIAGVFSGGLRQEHGIFWSFKDFIDAIENLLKKRNYLEHYEERKAKNQSFPDRDNARVIENLGILLLPELCGMLEMSARSVKGRKACEAAEQMKTMFAWCKQERAESIRKMFSEERKRSRLEKGRRKALAPDADNTQIWLKSYTSLGISPTDYRQFQFKRRYDFIGQQNLRRLFRELGAPLQQKKRALVYESDAHKISFRYSVEPLYLLAVRINKIILRFTDFAPKDEKGKIQDAVLRDIRNTLAHNGLFWAVYRKDAKLPMTVDEVFEAVLQPLDKSRRSQFCDRIESTLRRENFSVMHSVDDEGHPKSEKVRRRNEDRRAMGKREDVTTDNRRALRKVAAKWMKALQRAGQNNGLPKAGKNAN